MRRRPGSSTKDRQAIHAVDPTSLVVTSRKDTMVTARRADGSRVTRNVSMFRSLPYEPPPLQSDVEGDFNDDSGTEATLPTAYCKPRRPRDADRDR